MRAVWDLTHLRVGEAASSNLFFVVSLPVIAVVLGLWTADRWRGTERGASSLTTPLLVVAGVLLAVFTVLRNTPAGAWLAP